MLTFIQLLLTIVAQVTEYMNTKNLMDAGAAKAILKGVRDADDAINRAKRARANADSVSVDDDQFNRDRDK